MEQYSAIVMDTVMTGALRGQRGGGGGGGEKKNFFLFFFFF